MVFLIQPDRRRLYPSTPGPAARPLRGFDIRWKAPVGFTVLTERHDPAPQERRSLREQTDSFETTGSAFVEGRRDRA
jgi:hypothetical protein